MRKRSLCCLLFTIIITFCGCQATDKGKVESTVGQSASELTTAPTQIPVMLSFEAEEATLYGKVNVLEGFAEASLGGYVTGFEEDEDACEFKVAIETEGFYDLNFISKCSGGSKENFIFVDNEKIGAVKTESSEFADALINRVFLSSGDHSIKIVKSWGWIDLDKLVLTSSKEIDKSIYDVPATLVNSNATENTTRLMSYMTDIYGEKILSGQYCDTGMYGNEMAAIWNVTDGKFPAVLGLDFIEASPSRVERGSASKATEYAIEFYDKGGIVTFAWHWNAPSKYLTGDWYRGFYTTDTNIDLAKIMKGEDPKGYDLLMTDIDAIAKELKLLDEAGVPILWRPLHEASGGWFWWGAKGAEAYKDLYVLLYDRLTVEYGINNLIWIWNGQDKDWYPGDEYVDIIGEDIYPGERVYSSQIGKYLEAKEYSQSKKMVVLSENGCLFDPDLAIRDGAMWGFFATWGGEFVTKSKTINWYSEKYTEEYMLKKIYSHESVITLDELPDLKTYLSPAK